jgi:hypothetical protein
MCGLKQILNFFFGVPMQLLTNTKSCHARGLI